MVQAELQPHVAERMHYMVDVAPCLAAADTPDDAQACIGSGSATCMETEADGYTTFGMAACTQAETQAWDDLLNSEYVALRDRARAMDAGETNPDYAVRADALLTAQRAWIAFRDAECALAYSEFGGGSMRRLSASGCHLQMTAERTIDLHFMFESY
jgi:uncharacterized protein YecT (DUF1311 family)